MLVRRCLYGESADQGKPSLTSEVACLALLAEGSSGDFFAILCGDYYTWISSVSAFMICLVEDAAFHFSMEVTVRGPYSFLRAVSDITI